MSRRELDPAVVSKRLSWLREHWTPEAIESARARMQPQPKAETFADGVARRLAELRALDELTRRLHQARPSVARDGADD
ncbi:MAG: hypothetical protein ACE37F_31530 [Nannocystaceae bacterium]|nr:hypothetical protein [bacterium]